MSEIKNESLFSNERFVIISRVTNKITDFLNHLITPPLDNTLVILLSENLDKKSKLRQLFEKNKELICVPFYEDDERSLIKIDILVVWLL